MPKRRANGEGSLRKRKDGRWEGRYTAGYDPATGKPIHKNVLAKTQTEAKEKLKQAIANAAKLDMSRAKSYTLASWITLWYEVYAEPRLREKTKDYYRNYIDNHIIPELGDTPLEKLTTGLRRGELLALLWTDLDVEAKTISVTKQVNRINGELVVSQPKTQNSMRTLAIPQQAVDLLVEEPKKHPGNPYLFPSPKTGTMFDPDSFRHTHDKILKAIGAEHIRFHDLRHTFATLSLKNGVDVKTLSGTLGHYDAGFTLSTYTHATEEMRRDAADTIGNVISQAMYVHIEDWRNRPLQGGKYPYVYVDGIYLRRNWGGEYENVAILVAIAVNEDGYREVLGAAEGMKEDKASWVSFFQWLKGRGLDGVKLIVGDKCLGMLEAVGEVFPDVKYQRCTVHFYRNAFSVVPRSKVKLVAKMLKAIHAQESKKAAREKAKAVVAELKDMKLKEAAKKVEDGIEETLTYCDFPSEHWTRIRTNNVIERLNREIRRRTRVVGSFPDGNSALMLVCARLRHVAGTQWGNKKYMNMKHLETALEDASIAG